MQSPQLNDSFDAVAAAEKFFSSEALGDKSLFQLPTKQNTAEECRQLVAYFGEQDPGGGCWEYIKLHHADLWTSHMKAFRSGDLDQARGSFDEMVTAWGTRNKAVQPELLAA